MCYIYFPPEIIRGQEEDITMSITLLDLIYGSLVFLAIIATMLAIIATLMSALKLLKHYAKSVRPLFEKNEALFAKIAILFTAFAIIAFLLQKELALPLIVVPVIIAGYGSFVDHVRKSEKSKQ
jgi:amino acid transporter